MNKSINQSEFSYIAISVHCYLFIYHSLLVHIHLFLSLSISLSSSVISYLSIYLSQSVHIYLSMQQQTVTRTLLHALLFFLSFFPERRKRTKAMGNPPNFNLTFALFIFFPPLVRGRESQGVMVSFNLSLNAYRPRHYSVQSEKEIILKEQVGRTNLLFICHPNGISSDLLIFHSYLLKMTNVCIYKTITAFL